MIKRHRRWFAFTCVGLAVFAASFGLMPTAMQLRFTGNRALLYAAAVAFWIGAITAAVSGWRMNRNRRGVAREPGKIGLVTFFSTRTAIVIDVLWFLSTLVLIAAVVKDPRNQRLLPLFSVFLLLLFAHAMVNGKNYRFLKHNLA